MSDHIKRAAEVIAPLIANATACGYDPKGTCGTCRADSGLLVTPEHDAAVAARALRGAADRLNRDRRIHDASCGESPAQTHEQAGRDYGVTTGLRQAVRHLNERADRTPQAD